MRSTTPAVIIVIVIVVVVVMTAMVAEIFVGDGQVTREAAHRQRTDHLPGAWIDERPVVTDFGTLIRRGVRIDGAVTVSLGTRPIPVHQLHRPRRIVLKLHLRTAATALGLRRTGHGQQTEATRHDSQQQGEE